MWFEIMMSSMSYKRNLINKFRIRKQKFNDQNIIEAVDKAILKESYAGTNYYYNQYSADLIVNHIKQLDEIV